MKQPEITSFISCDWGTSSLRLRYVDTGGMTIRGEWRSDQGISGTFGQWQSQLPEVARIPYFCAILLQGLKQLEELSGAVTAGLPVLCSGMASSSVGIRELPYAELPFALDGSCGKVDSITAENLSNPLFLISGVKDASDVMRGEETELLGAVQLIPGLPSSYLAIIPGTHCKHIRVQDGRIVGFRTYLTGELFQLLMHHSTLRHSIEAPAQPRCDAFRQGVERASHAPLLSNLFQVRVNTLLKGGKKADNYEFLSGLLIGAELVALGTLPTLPIILMADHRLRPLYSRALSCLGLDNTFQEVPDPIFKRCVPAGQWHMYQQQKG